MQGEIRNVQGERLDYSYHEGNGNSQDVVVIGHGVTGNKDRPFVVALAEGLAQSGVSVLRVSFSGNGNSEGRFEDATISKEVGDLGSVLDALEGSRVVYVGHSMGGAVGVIRSSEDSRIQFLVSLAGMVDTQGFYEREFSDVVPGEGCMWDEPTCPLSQQYVDDMSAIGTVAGRASRIDVPWLLVHGTEDDVVPPGDSQEVFEKAPESKELFLVEGADHVFSEAATPVMVDKVVDWVKDCLA